MTNLRFESVQDGVDQHRLTSANGPGNDDDLSRTSGQSCSKLLPLRNAIEHQPVRPLAARTARKRRRAIVTDRAGAHRRAAGGEAWRLARLRPPTAHRPVDLRQQPFPGCILGQVEEVERHHLGQYAPALGGRDPDDQEWAAFAQRTP